MKIVIINGPNLNFLGIREPEIYGRQTLKEIESKIQKYAEQQKVVCTFFQSNSEGELIDRIQQAHIDKVDGIVLNPAAYTHYSYAIHDAVKSVDVPTVEVHLSAIHARESFRKDSVVATACIGQISGFGATGYLLAIQALKEVKNKGEN